MERFIQLIHQTNDGRFNLVNIVREIENTENPTNEESPNIPVQREFIESLKEIEIKQENITCSLCLEDFRRNEKGICLPCKDTPHYFHAGNGDCPGIFEWFKKKNTCPICRFEFPKEESNQNPEPFDPSSQILEQIILNPGPQNMNEIISNNILNSLQNTLLRREEQRQMEIAIQTSINDQ